MLGTDYAGRIGILITAIGVKYQCVNSINVFWSMFEILIYYGESSATEP